MPAYIVRTQPFGGGTGGQLAQFCSFDILQLHILMNRADIVNNPTCEANIVEIKGNSLKKDFINLFPSQVYKLLCGLRMVYRSPEKESIIQIINEKGYQNWREITPKCFRLCTN